MRRLSYYRILLLASLFGTGISPLDVAGAEAGPAERFSQRFATFCLRGSLTTEAFEARALALGAAPNKDLPMPPGEGFPRIKSWHGVDGAEPFILSASVADIPSQRLRIVGCQASTSVILASEIVQALSQVPELGQPNDNNSPSLIRRDAGWFIKIASQPAWVSVSDLTGISNGGQVLVGISIHLELTAKSP